jgi:transcriptional regulator with XRE-family HTH domain
MANERLRSGIAARGMTVGDVATQVEVDPKTVERWISSDRVPHRSHRWATARLLGVDEAYLWPQVLTDDRTVSASRAELVDIYPNRGSVPPDLWRALAGKASEAVDVLAYSALFLPDSNPDLPPELAKRASDGMQVRILLGDPASDAVRKRGEEEGIDDGLAGRIRLHLRYLEPVMDQAGIEIRLHTTTLYNSLYRFDQSLLVNSHAYGAPASHSPVLHLQRVPGGRLFDHYMVSFDRVWARGRAITNQPEREDV